jgi:hypothetical protein
MEFPSFVKLDYRTAPFFFLTFLGIIFYFVWGLAYGGWFDIGVYSITILLLGFGFSGIYLYSILEDE